MGVFRYCQRLRAIAMHYGSVSIGQQRRLRLRRTPDIGGISASQAQQTLPLALQPDYFRIKGMTKAMVRPEELLSQRLVWSG